MDRCHIQAREDHFCMAQRQTRPNLHLFARYPRGIYDHQGKSWVCCRISGNWPGTAAFEIGSKKFLEQNCDTRQNQTFSFIFNISHSIYTYVQFLRNHLLGDQMTRRDRPWIDCTNISEVNHIDIGLRHFYFQCNTRVTNFSRLLLNDNAGSLNIKHTLIKIVLFILLSR